MSDAPIDISTGLPTAAPPAAAAAPAGGAVDAGSENPPGVLPILDRVDIQPLDLAAGLQILIAELRLELALPAALSATPLQTPTQAARELIRLFLQAISVDEGAEAAAPLRAADLDLDAERALQSALDQAVATVSAWRNVPSSVADAVVETRAMALRQLNDEPPSAAWLPPEWAGLAPAMSRYWRRRRARRRLTDPDTRQSPAADADAAAADVPAADAKPGPR